MNGTIATAIVQGFDGYKQERLVLGDTKWTWAAGTVLFPEVSCPLCGAGMRSNSIWLISEGARRLNGQLQLKGSKLVRRSPAHPHVNDRGGVCTGKRPDGTGYSVFEALFLGINLAEAYGGWDGYACRGWLADYFDHKCSKRMVAGLAASLARAEAPVAEKKPELVDWHEIAAPPPEPRLFNGRPIATPAVPREGQLFGGLSSGARARLEELRQLRQQRQQADQLFTGEGLQNGPGISAD